MWYVLLGFTLTLALSVAFTVPKPRARNTECALRFALADRDSFTMLDVVIEYPYCLGRLP